MSQKRKTKEELSGANRELQKVKITRDQIVAEYLTSNYTYREPAIKYYSSYLNIFNKLIHYYFNN